MVNKNRIGKSDIKSRKSFLQRLRSDTAGNTMAMAAAALFPIAGMIGGGVDIGRAYMAQARLQQACDAGALAGRRAMSGASLSADDKAEALKYFNFNFQDGVFGTNPFQQIDGKENPRFIDGPGDRTVQGFAETTINTSIMRIFGYTEMTIKAECASRLDIGNVDVMMVMDVTGSMDWRPDNSRTSTESEKRITGLKNAVKEFYDILGPGGGLSGSQVRYGFMPYNAMINVGEALYDEDPSWIVGGTGIAEEDEWNYQSRRAHWKMYSNVLEYLDPYYTSGNRNSCTNMVSKTDNGYYYEYSPGSYNSWSGTCTRQRRKYASEPIKLPEWESGAVLDYWEYGQFSHDVSAYVASIKSGNSTLRPTLYDNPNNPTDGPKDIWKGCIEERYTNSGITKTTNSIPADAYDLDINLIPSSKATRWKPYWEGVEYRRSNSRDGSSASSSECPVPGRRLASYATYDSEGTDSDGNVITKSLKTYINGLTPAGNTNHTIGMIWGARFLSGTGLFAAENSKTKNGFNITRHLVFMTDGDLNVFPDSYNVYGYNKLDGRLGPTSLNQDDYEDRQEQRFQLMCSAAKAQGITVWTIQFTASSTVGSNLLNCASSPKHAAAATSNEALKAAFSNIAKTIGGLRLSK